MSRHVLAELGIVTVASPCQADWSAMRGDDRARHCALCNLNVYNVEGLTSFEVRSLFQRSEGRVCMRLFQREDGTLITKDCPVGAMGVGEAWRQQRLRAKLLSPKTLAWVTLAVLGTAQLVFSQWAEARFAGPACRLPARAERSTRSMGLVILPPQKKPPFKL
jgi:hypothetical protein